jgi:transposase InsO family protein
MPFRGRSVPDERLRFAVLASRRERTISELCREFGISRQCGHGWLKRYRDGGAGAVLNERNRRPHHSPRRTATSITSEILQLRRRWPDWGADKLHSLLLRDHPDVRISPRTVHRILLREGLVREDDRHPPATGQFERSAPNELWQMDFKGPKGFRQRPGPLSVIDDHSRYVLALEHLDSGRIDAVAGCLRRTFERGGLPEAMLMDHGTPWWNASSAWGWTELSVWIMRQGIRILLSGYRHPQTQGKVERMHGTLSRSIRRRGADADDQSWLDAFREEYNSVRPHAALGMQTPVSRWRRAEREYQAEPKQWEYGAGQEVATVNQHGRLLWRKATYHLSSALRGLTVGIERLEQGALIYYCNTPLAAIDERKLIALPVDPFRSLQY